MTVRIVGLTLSRGGGACLVEDGVLRSALPHDSGLGTANVDHWVTSGEHARYLDRKVLSLPDPGDQLALASAAFYSSGYEEAASLVVGPADTGFHFRIGTTPERVPDITGNAAVIDPNCIIEPNCLGLGLAQRDDGLRLLPQQPAEQFHYDLAAQIQAEAEDAVLAQARELLAKTKTRSLVLSGDVFLNSMVNTRIKNETGVDRLFVFPSASGEAIAAGAALYAHHNLIGRSPKAKAALPSIYLGPSIKAGTHLEALAVRRHDQVARAAAGAIARGEIVGWCQDRAELGPNALGARSILCHPSLAGMREQLNARVPGRTAVSPFAGSVLAEQAQQWFTLPAPDSPFMQYSGEVLPHRRAMIGELVNADGTCRVQTVAEDDPGPFRALIESFEDQTGLPVVVTTAFHPALGDPEDALDLLRSAVLDRLFIGDLEFEAPAAGIPQQPTDPARCAAPHPPRAPHLAVPL